MPALGARSRNLTDTRALKGLDILTESKQPTTSGARISVPHPYLALMGLYLGGFTGMYSETALNIALPQLSGAFAVDIALTQWLVVGYMLVIGIAMPFSSLLTRWFSARRITIFALGAFLVGSLLSGSAPRGTGPGYGPGAPAHVCDGARGV